MERQIYGVKLTPTGVFVDIERFGEWGLSYADVAVLRNGDHLLRGTWPEHEEWCTESWMIYADELVANLLDSAFAKATGGAP